MTGITRETARAVATHFRLAAVRIVVAHPEICTVHRAFEYQHAIGADTAMPVADLRDLIGREMQIAGAIIDQDEIVARAVHFRETQHAQLVSTFSRQSQTGLAEASPRKHQAPNTKLQRSSKFQVSSPSGDYLDVWILVFLWSLDVGARCF